MFNRIWIAATHPTPRQRIVILSLCCAAAVGGLGCATMYAANRDNPRAEKHYNEPILTDTICALAIPDESLSEKVGSDAIAFLGQKHTYLLVQGGDELVRIGRELDGEFLTIEGNQRRMFMKDTTIWGEINMTYQIPDELTADAATTNQLIELGFTPRRSGTYERTTAVKGAIQPPLDIKDVPAFKKCRDISFFNPPDSSPPPDLDKYVLVPLGVATDIILTPVYLFGILVLAITNPQIF